MDIEDIINKNINTDWKPVLIKLLQPYKKDINNDLNNEINEYTKKRIFPNENLIFACFNYFDIKDLKCLIIGQDCYHTEGVANGLCFSHYPQKNNKLQPSLNNIFKELNRTEKNIRTNFKKLGCLFEAFIAALFLDVNKVIVKDEENWFSNIFSTGPGFQMAQKFIENIIKDRFENWLSNSPQQAEKLLEWIISFTEERLRRKKERNKKWH